MNKSAKRLALLFFSLLASSAIFFSCTDVDNTLGLELIPDDEQRDFKIDTLYPEAYTMTIDSVYTSMATTFMIGSYYDPMFGQVVSGSVFQIMPAYDSLDFGTNPTYESLILRLVLNSAPIGDENIAQKISVYELTERIYYDSAYYACTPIKTMIEESKPIASVMYNGEDTLNVELGPVFANKLLHASKDVMAYNQDTVYNSPFFDYVKGLYVVAEPIVGGGRMNFFNPTASVYLTYSNVDSANITSMYDNIYSYDYNEGVYYYSQFNAVERDSASANPAEAMPFNKLNDTTATGLDDKLYLQGFYGATPYIKISSDTLKKWLQDINLDASQAAIIRAELVMEAEDGFSGFDITKYPNALGAMTRLNPLTSYSYYYGNMYVAGCLSSFYYALSQFDGNLNKTHKKYSFNITHEVINQLRDNTDLKFYLAPYTDNTSKNNSASASYNTLLYSLGPSQNKAYKAVFKGPKHSEPLKLIISYAIPH